MKLKTKAFVILMAIPAFAGMTIAQGEKGGESVGVGEAKDNAAPTHLPTPTPSFYFEEPVIPAKAGIACQTCKAYILQTILHSL